MAEERTGEAIPLDSGGAHAEGVYFAGERATAGVVLVGGTGGGFDSPAQDLYGRLAQLLPDEAWSDTRSAARW